MSRVVKRPFMPLRGANKPEAKESKKKETEVPGRERRFPTRTKKDLECSEKKGKRARRLQEKETKKNGLDFGKTASSGQKICKRKEFLAGEGGRAKEVQGTQQRRKGNCLKEGKAANKNRCQSRCPW